MNCPKCKSEMRRIKARRKDDLGKTVFVCPGGCARWEDWGEIIQCEECKKQFIVGNVSW